jgi:hypothetical protein
MLSHESKTVCHTKYTVWVFRRALQVTVLSKSNHLTGRQKRWKWVLTNILRVVSAESCPLATKVIRNYLHTYVDNSGKKSWRRELACEYGNLSVIRCYKRSADKGRCAKRWFIDRVKLICALLQPNLSSSAHTKALKKCHVYENSCFEMGLY